MSEDEVMDPLKDHIIQGIKETLVWYQQSDQKDERNDNLSGILLSRFASKS